ncbi:hypothetical protein FALBO_6366 [Fusarium albosuccineum]|uniref:Zn(2)-C6 fungal-type domain-containing protein n=1 Tax=Fusarium albosuccineum TaxID=1237068 RepID=A0A8H4LBU0_9HYPO|nr:hypothetical protein FALBO_6366 [Fusarium albosuccineum]
MFTIQLKCDEEKPSCHNCAVRRIVCPGYQQTLKWSTKHERRGRRNTNDPPDLDQLISAASVSVQERRITETQFQSDGRSPGAIAHLTPSLSPTQTHDVSYTGIITPQSTGDTTCVVSAAINYSHLPRNGSQRRRSLPTHQVGDGLRASSEMALEIKPRAAIPSCTEDANEIEVAVYKGCSPSYIPITSPTQAISEPSTFLIELWFKSVCGAWAAYDSPVNPFRKLGSSLWGSSRPLFYSLQSMAAASLTRRQPEIQEIAASAPRIATEAIIHELKTLFEAPNSVTAIPHALIISLFCLSSSLCWMDHKQLGLQYLRHVRVILSLLEMRSKYLSKEDQKLVAFFKECLIYEESVRSIVTSYRDDISTLIEWTPATYPPYDFVLHPWTGVPPRIIGLFGKAMSLCRRSRDTWRNCIAPTYEVMWQAMLDINEAQTLEETLLSVEVPKLIEDVGQEHNDRSGLNLDLHHAAEVFRLSSLLQLYQTFPDLVSRRLPEKIDAGGTITKTTWPTSLALHITGLLSDIPAESIRCLQPLLCLGVGTGLRCKSVSTEEAPPRLELLDTYHSAVSQPTISDTETFSQRHFTDVSLAREFIMNRLKGFGQGPAAGPIIILRELLQAVWACYDSEVVPGSIHWLDVMADLKYETVLG